MVNGLAVGGTLGHGAFAATAAEADAVDHVAWTRNNGPLVTRTDDRRVVPDDRRRRRGLTLLGLVAQSPSLVGSGGPRSTVQVGQLAILPAAHTEEEPQHIRLLLAPQLLHILICSHLDLSTGRGRRNLGEAQVFPHRQQAGYKGRPMEVTTEHLPNCKTFRPFG